MAKAKTSDLLPGSPEQEAIWKELLKGNRNVVVNAVAGSGKTWTGVQYCKRDKENEIAYVAFNKHIKEELSKKIDQPNVDTMTYHSLGYKALRGALKNVQLDNDKLDGILEKIVVRPTEWESRTLRTRVRQHVSLAKQYGAWDREEFQKLVEHHALDLNGVEEVVYEYTPRVLEACKKNTKTIDFDDMVWLPRELGVKVPKYDVMLIDEAQDTNISQ